MNLVQMSRSLSDFLSSPGMYENTRQLKALGEQNTPFPLGMHPNLGGGNDCFFTCLPVDQACQHVGEPRQAIDLLGFLAEFHHAWRSACP